jgi:hypothetical protein
VNYFHSFTEASTHVNAIKRYIKALEAISERYGPMDHQVCGVSIADFMREYVTFAYEMVDYAESDSWRLGSVIYKDGVERKQLLMFWLPEDICAVELKLLIS